MTMLWRSLVALVLLHESLSRKFSPGPTVDPGVFVITHISTCRNGAGYCILGFSCSVDNDFTSDDLGGHCMGLADSFGPRASFVCCRENPELHPPAEIPELPAQQNAEIPAQQNTEAPETSTSVVTEMVTEIVTELVPVTEMVTEILKPGIVIDEEPIKNAQYRVDEGSPNVNCFAAILLGIKCSFEDIDLSSERKSAEPTNYVLVSSSNNDKQKTTPQSVELPAQLLVEVISESLKKTEVIAAEIQETTDYEMPATTAESEYQVEVTETPQLKSEQVTAEATETPRLKSEQVTAEATEIYLVVAELLQETTSKQPDEIVPEDGMQDTLDVPTEIPVQTTTAAEPLDNNDDLTTAETTPESTQGLISTLADLQPDRDDTFQASVLLSAQSLTQVSATAGSQQQEEIEAELRSSADSAQCGKLGGAAVLQAFGRAAHNLLPDLVFSWVTGGQGTKKNPSARFDDEEELEPRIIAGDVTSTVLYCWMAAIMEVSKDGDEPDQFICTGTLVQPDLVVTSASCTLRMFETGVHNFHVVVGDSNLKIDLPFGVQIHEISQVIVHENYRPDDSFHYEDIGLIKLKTNAKMETTVCLLCLPEEHSEYLAENCTVVGYGRPSAIALNAFEREDNQIDVTDGILRKADLPIVDTILCQEYLDINARSDDMHSGFLCAGGKGAEESCYIAMDGGSPLACKRDKDHYELAGLVTFGTSCSHDQSPSLFTNVSKHYKWIMENYHSMSKK